MLRPFFTQRRCRFSRNVWTISDCRPPLKMISGTLISKEKPRPDTKKFAKNLSPLPRYSIKIMMTRTSKTSILCGRKETCSDSSPSCVMSRTWRVPRTLWGRFAALSSRFKLFGASTLQKVYPTLSTSLAPTSPSVVVLSTLVLVRSSTVKGRSSRANLSSSVISFSDKIKSK